MDFKNSYTPYIRVKDDVKIVMLDVIFARNVNRTFSLWT